jgi:hypothetical protein
LQAADADILCIFDCCYAGSLLYHRGPAHFEYLGACASDQTTPPGGENSFTSALIWALNWFHSQENFTFDVCELQRKIKDYEPLPSKQYPSLGHRHPSREHIVISPQESKDQQKCLSIHETKKSKGPYDMVDIRYHFDGKLDDEAFSAFARGISSSGATMDIPIPVRRVQFMEKRSSLNIGGLIKAIAADLFKRMIQRRFVYMWLRVLKKSPKCNIKWRAIESRERSLHEWLKVHKSPGPIPSGSPGVTMMKEPEAEGRDTGQSCSTPLSAPTLGEPTGGLNTPVATDYQGSISPVKTPEERPPLLLPSNPSTKRKQRQDSGLNSQQGRKKTKR